MVSPHHCFSGLQGCRLLGDHVLLGFPAPMCRADKCGVQMHYRHARPHVYDARRTQRPMLARAASSTQWENLFYSCFLQTNRLHLIITVHCKSCECFKGYRTKKDGRFLKDGTFASKHLCSEKIWRTVVCLIEAVVH